MLLIWEIYVTQIRQELSYFRIFDVPLDSTQNPFLWWSKHKGQLPTLVYVARTISNIHGNQVEIERVFSIAIWIWSNQHFE
jgi:hypothetical protein